MTEYRIVKEESNKDDRIWYFVEQKFLFFWWSRFTWGGLDVVFETELKAIDYVNSKKETKKKIIKTIIKEF